MSEITELSLKQIAEGVRGGNFSAIEVLQAFLKNIAEKEDDLNAFITVNSKGALTQAKEIKKGQQGRLLGVPVALKDNISTRGLRTTAGSKIIEDYIPPYNATVVAKLLAEGAIILGKTNMDEFAMGSSTENSAYGVTHNPHDLTRVPGGSSGGSAAAVAARLAPTALGTDTGGSIKQPAAFCGVVGLRPTYGAVSRYGVIALTSSLDQVGPLAKTVEDARTIFEVIAGKDPYDATGVEMASEEPKKLESLRIGIPKEYLGEGLDPAIAEMVKKVGEFLEKQGAAIQEVSLPHTHYGLAVYYIITPSEVSSNLARFDGIRYGVRVEDSSIEELVSRSRGKGFGSEPKRRIILGTFALSSGYADQYYLRAAKVRTLIAQDFARAFEKVDLLLTPTAPTTAFKIGEKKDPLSMYLSDIFTIPANLAGLPGLSVPVGTIKNLPVGVQLLGPKFSENMLFDVGEAIERKKWS
ncbi:aspartyl/glutamyl-tRNA amidotransferase subunit A [candidate division WWE3 bacterium RBG_19FT_COMBO_53_11]|uniref:Glutamyl-tRNA(Gln) amidotransferase subunit A n=1 Tax=candidate division WWE3 bacterium RBG_19FT_COMBO_53_11 TaxID=1802613 RepID=A0A1F4UHV1_UNCKA|nr:MAG: aspartyl/glutamyl-tRNA amidotransferase subunit A [candidate division WWE3 bacterium RBG_16_52_45]OGC44548.1 MAG: aspartyl/glutamyl-tRNA amidotransferase subunit A [candidate division WWE3 bacterium RBG_19FT_COMBO_53_11]